MPDILRYLDLSWEVVVHACDPSAQEVDAGGFLS